MPKNSPHIKVTDNEVEMSVENLIRLTENFFLCGRMEVSDSLEEYRDGLPYFH